jgi:excisionase family DNA binding protein
MRATLDYTRPSMQERKMAQSSYSTLRQAISQLQSEEVDIEIIGSNDKLELPLSVLRLLEDILKNMSEGKIVSIVPLATELTTQKAAEILGCSRPFLVNLLEEGKIPFTKVGKHRRIMFEDVMQYKAKMKAVQKQHLIEMMAVDEEEGLYDS